MDNIKLSASFHKHTLNFRFSAGTSRGTLHKKDSYFLKIWDEKHPNVFGIGEASPLKYLSPEYGKSTEDYLLTTSKRIKNNRLNITNLKDLAYELNEWSSIRMALETAIKDFENGGIRKIFENNFFEKGERIAINGLVWMGDIEFMKKQVVEKISQNYSTIKLKVGALDFHKEIELLQEIRKNFNHLNLTIRLDANGAFHKNEALEKLKHLSKFNIHSIEQPINAGQWDELATLCEKSPIPIALDEELILNLDKKEMLLDHVQPHFIIIKPSLMGGLSGSKEWISLAEKKNIGWWITSALESNIGLNAVCQLASKTQNALPQGLGTGQLYHNNFNSPLQIENGQIYYAKEKQWNLNPLYTLT